MKIKWRYGIAFPLMLALALGGLASWLGRISEIQTEEIKLDPGKPQYAMQGISGKRFDEQGRLKEHLTAQKAWKFPDSKAVHLSRPLLELYRGGKLQYRVGSNEAVYHTDNKEVRFNQDVVLTKTSSANQAAGILRTAKLIIDTENQSAKTESLVEFEMGDSHGTANGMTYNHKQGLLTFPSRVKAIIYDVRKP